MNHILFPSDERLSIKLVDKAIGKTFSKNLKGIGVSNRRLKTVDFFTFCSRKNRDSLKCLSLHKKTYSSRFNQKGINYLLFILPNSIRSPLFDLLSSLLGVKIVVIVDSLKIFPSASRKFARRNFFSSFLSACSNGSRLS